MYLFALPLVSNKTGAPVTITGYSIRSITGAARVTGYFVYSLRDAPDHSIHYDETVGKPDGGFVLSDLPNYASDRRTLEPHKHDDLIAMVKVVLERKVRSQLRGCTVRYQTRGHSYRQTFRCDYALGSDRP